MMMMVTMIYMMMMMVVSVINMMMMMVTMIYMMMMMVCMMNMMMMMVCLMNTSFEKLGCEFESKRVMSSTDEFFNKYTLNRSATMELEDTGPINVHLVLSLVVAWIA